MPCMLLYLLKFLLFFSSVLPPLVYDVLQLLVEFHLLGFVPGPEFFLPPEM